MNLENIVCNEIFDGNVVTGQGYIDCIDESSGIINISNKRNEEIMAGTNPGVSLFKLFLKALA